MEEAIGAQMQRGRRTGETHSLLMLDLDHFKAINDSFGHSVGDLVLQHVATILQANVRKIDYVRGWGEEFLVSCPRPPWIPHEALPNACANNLQRIRCTSTAASRPVGQHRRRPMGEHLRGNVAATRAGRYRVYQAKAQGRNRVCESVADNTVGASSAMLTAEAPARR